MNIRKLAFRLGVATATALALLVGGIESAAPARADSICGMQAVDPYCPLNVPVPGATFVYGSCSAANDGARRTTAAGYTVECKHGVGGFQWTLVG